MMKRILIIEPDEALAALLEMILQEEGYAVNVCYNLAAARLLLCHTRFDAIISEAFNQDELFSFNPGFLNDLWHAAGGTPIMLCSTDSYALGLHAGDFGLADIVFKPLDVDDLPRRVKRMIDRP